MLLKNIQRTTQSQELACILFLIRCSRTIFLIMIPFSFFLYQSVLALVQLSLVKYNQTLWCYFELCQQNSMYYTVFQVKYQLKKTMVTVTTIKLNYFFESIVKSILFCLQIWVKTLLQLHASIQKNGSDSVPCCTIQQCEVLRTQQLHFSLQTWKTIICCS